MIKKLFRNRITLEKQEVIDKLKSTYIEMNYGETNKYNKKKRKRNIITTPNTPDGLFFISLNPNCYVDETTLQDDFEFVLKLFYRWRYGPKWTTKKELQYQYEGIIEQQNWKNHIHFKLYDEKLNMAELAIFLGYIKAVFKQLYPKASTDFQRIYDVNGCNEYVQPFNNKKRTAPPIYITNIQR